MKTDFLIRQCGRWKFHRLNRTEPKAAPGLTSRKPRSLRERFDKNHTRHERTPWKMPGEKWSRRGKCLRALGGFARDTRHQRIHKDKRLTMRQAKRDGIFPTHCGSGGSGFSPEVSCGASPVGGAETKYANRQLPFTIVNPARYPE